MRPLVFSGMEYLKICSETSLLLNSIIFSEWFYNLTIAYICVAFRTEERSCCALYIQPAKSNQSNEKRTMPNNKMAMALAVAMYETHIHYVKCAQCPKFAWPFWLADENRWMKRVVETSVFENDDWHWKSIQVDSSVRQPSRAMYFLILKRKRTTLTASFRLTHGYQYVVDGHIALSSCVHFNLSSLRCVLQHSKCFIADHKLFKPRKLLAQLFRWCHNTKNDCDLSQYRNSAFRCVIRNRTVAQLTNRWPKICKFNEVNSERSQFTHLFLCPFLLLILLLLCLDNKWLIMCSKFALYKQFHCKWIFFL